MRAPAKRRPSVFRRLMVAFGGLALLMGVAAASLVTFLREDRITELAKDQIARLAGTGYETNLASASLNIFQNGIASVELSGISVRNAQTRQRLLEQGNATFSVSLASLLVGRIELTELSLTDAVMAFSAQDAQAPDLLENLKGEDGLFDPALLAKTLNDVANTISNRLNANPDLVIKARNTKLVFGNESKPITVLLEEMVASKTISNAFAFNAVISNNNWKTGLTGMIGLGAEQSDKTPYKLAVNPVPFTRSFAPQLPDLKPRNCTGLAGFAVASANGQASVDVNLTKTNCTFGQLGDYAIEAEIKGNLKRGDGVFEIGSGAINVNRSVFNFTGAIAPARYTPKPTTAGQTARYRYELVFTPSIIDSLDNVDEPLAFEGKIAGTYAPFEQRLAIDELIADADGSILSGAASLLFTDVTPALYLALTADQLRVKDFKRIWPRFAAPNTRQTINERVLDGTIRNLRFELQLPPGKIGSKTPLERAQLKGSGDFENALFTTFGDLPPVDKATGTVAFDGKTVDVKVTKGLATLPSGRKVSLSPSSFLIADTHLKPTPAVLNIDISGTADAIAEVAAQKPINALANQELSPQDFSGNASAKASVGLKLVQRGEKAPLPVYKIQVSLSELSISKAINGQKITNASGTVIANNQGATVALGAQLGGVPAKISIFEPRGAPEKRKQEVLLTLTEALRNQVAPGLKQFLSGPVSARISGNDKSANVEVDLTKAALRVSPMNWEKGAGIGAKASFNVSQSGTELTISDLKVTGRSLQATGELQVSNGTLKSAELNNVKLNPGDDFSLRLTNNGKTLDAILGGNQLDARSILKQILPGRQQPKNASNQALNVKGKIQRLTGFNEEVVLNAEFGFSAGAKSGLSLKGDFESGGAVDISRSLGANGRLILQTGNAGAALRFADLYKRMIGGRLATDFVVGANEALIGPLSISDFTVVGEPRLAELVNEQAKGSTSLAEATNADLAGQKAKFELAQGDVVLDRGTIRLKNGIVRGANVGATAEGIVLSATGQMDLRGTFMPARGLNRIVGAIPILGLLLGSGGNAGLIGITYQLAGEAKNPRVFVNPISIIAPGVFRQIFE